MKYFVFNDFQSKLSIEMNVFHRIKHDLLGWEKWIRWDVHLNGKCFNSFCSGTGCPRFRTNILRCHIQMSLSTGTWKCWSAPKDWTKTLPTLSFSCVGSFRHLVTVSTMSVTRMPICIHHTSTKLTPRHLTQNFYQSITQAWITHPALSVTSGKRGSWS